ncbi:hypothetical protein QBC41DRAFT_347165 [Cercophora samala]|uniref:Uncharacterized protein n=1 Tax=Cercophora samala TaxID=330535 RepID=A0AA40DCB6_9PEZI|nr:hypothetical protein QBC41DRAFT_347165 [Cercophora samala]
MGWLFKLELLPYRYTFVAKGTLKGRPRRLKHKCGVYARLEILQGDVIPVHLGLVRLDRGYIIPGFEFVVHMVLMSWAGEKPSASVRDDGTQNLKREEESLTDNLEGRVGVDHGDDNNAAIYLWNVERCRMVIIDFDRARLFPPR